MAKYRFWAKAKQIIERGGPIVAVVTIVIVGFFGSEWLMHEDVAEAEGDRAHGANHDETFAIAPVVRLTPEKIKWAKITTEQVGKQLLRGTRTVSGTIQYDTARHLDVRAPVNCVVKKSLVSPGQWVQKDERLASLTSAEVGLARNELLKSEAELRLANLQNEWAVQTHANLADLLALLKQRPAIEDVEKEFEGKLLGDHRDTLITAYSQYLLATSVATRTETLQSQGIISGRTSDERASQREVMAANFKAMCEQAGFESKRDSQLAAAELDAAEREVEVSRDRLSVLIGPHGAHSVDQSRSDFELTALKDASKSCTQSNPPDSEPAK